MGIDYVGHIHGVDSLVEYLVRYTKNVYKKVIGATKTDALGAIEEKIRETYKLEKSEDALTITNDGTKLNVKISYCPAVKHLRATGRDVSEYFSYSTEVVMQTLADAAGISFRMISYDNESGAAEYEFTK